MTPPTTAAATPPTTAKAPKRKAIKAEVKALNRLCYRDGVSTTARYLLVTLYSYTDQQGYCYPSHALLEKDTGLAERTIRKALSELESAGMIRIAKPPKTTGKAGVKASFSIGPRKLPRGQSVYIVWPVANAIGKAGFAALVGLRDDATNSLRQAPWFVKQQPGQPDHGPNSTDAIVGFIRGGSVHPDSKVRCTEKWFDAVDVQLFAPEFSLARRAAG